MTTCTTAERCEKYCRKNPRDLPKRCRLPFATGVTSSARRGHKVDRATCDFEGQRCVPSSGGRERETDRETEIQWHKSLASSHQRCNGFIKKNSLVVEMQPPPWRGMEKAERMALRGMFRSVEGGKKRKRTCTVRILKGVVVMMIFSFERWKCMQMKRKKTHHTSFSQ